MESHLYQCPFKSIICEKCGITVPKYILDLNDGIHNCIDYIKS